MIIMLFSLASPLAGEINAKDLDLSNQRGERQFIKKVPGEKTDHQGLIINPTPRKINITPGETLRVANGFDLKTTKSLKKQVEKDMTTVGLKQSGKGIPLKISVGTEGKTGTGIKETDGSYQMIISTKDITIRAYNEDAIFYALQTLKQIVSSPISSGGKIPVLTIEDFPNLQYRGLVEGFYGNPWSHQTRISLIEFLGKNKMNTYIYGPKDDPYHSSPNWRLPYPADEAKQIKELIDASKTNHVNFVWAIHPGQDIHWDEEDYNNLVGKFNDMYDLGVRSFAIFFDDISGIGADSRRQTELLNRLTEEFVKEKGDVANLMICPTDYTELWANPDTEKGQLAIYGQTLNPDVEVFWTGEVVCSDLTPETLKFVDSRIKRPALYWWNFPVTDYARNIIMQGPSYGLDTTLTSSELAGIVSNPMEHGEASRLALYGVGDYSWNTSDYNALDNWERALMEVAPEAADAYRTFAIHNGDTQKGYRRDESWETATFKFNDYTPEQFEALKNEFEKIAATPTEMQNISNKQLLKELEPWLIEFGKLGERGLKTLEIIKLYESGNYPAFLEAYNSNIMTEADRDAYNAHKVGTLVLQPFYEEVMKDIIEDYYRKTDLKNFGPVSMVNPFIGTTNRGVTNPGAMTPNGMMSVVPFNVTGSDINEYDKDDGWWSAPYDYENKFFTGYAHGALSGVGCPDMGSILSIATTGDLTPELKEYGSEYTDEIAVPGYYSNRLIKYDIKTEATATTRTSAERYTFPEGKGNIIINLGAGLTNESGAMVKKVNAYEIEGYKLLGTFCYRPQAVFPVYFVARVTKKPSSCGAWKFQPEVEGAKADWIEDNGTFKFYTNYNRELAGDEIGYWWTFDNLKENEQVELRIGISYTSIENARKNLESEQNFLAFDAIRSLATEKWNNELGRVKVYGGSEDQRKVFYTSLYHSLIHPNIISDVNGEYPRYEREGSQQSDYDRYTVFSLWDTYRTLHPLLTLIYPEKQLDMLRSLAGMANESGWLPRWELYGRETYTMEGDPAIPMIVDSYRKGLIDFPIWDAYDAMVKSSTTPGKSNPIRPDIDSYIELGYIPVGTYQDDMSGDNSVSHALEYYVADNALAWLADGYKYTDFADTLRNRAGGWKNYYSQESGTFRPIDHKGEFIRDFNPEIGKNFENVPGFHEGSAWNYSFYVPHDIKGLAEVMGGDSIFVEKLQYFFDKGLFDPTNEPDMGYPYIFNQFPGEEWRTQKEVNKILKENYSNKPDGLPGNDDSGTLSAWVVFSMAGLYPEAPAQPWYTLTSPVFDELEISLSNGNSVKITTDRKNKDDFYIESITWNGNPITDYRISHQELLKGGELHYVLKNER